MEERCKNILERHDVLIDLSKNLGLTFTKEETTAKLGWQDEDRVIDHRVFGSKVDLLYESTNTL